MRSGHRGAQGEALGLATPEQLQVAASSTSGGISVEEYLRRMGLFL